MKRRFVGAVLAGLGVLFLIFAGGLPFYVGPAVTRLPNDLKACPPADEPQPEGCLKPSVAEATGATFLDTSNGTINQGSLRNTTWVVPQPKTTANWQETSGTNRLTDDAFVWTVYGQADWIENQKPGISAYSTEFAVDRVTGAAVDWDGQWLDDQNLQVVPKRNVKYEGQTYKFPFGTEKIEYKIFDRDLRRALPAQFIDVTAVKGLEAYHFKQVIDRQEAQNVAPARLNLLRTIFAPDATSVRILYSNTREVWVDPVTGSYLNVREQQTKVLAPDTGTETTLLSADFKYTDETITNAVNAASNTHSRLKLLTLYAPIGLGLLGVLLLGVGAALMSGRRRRPDAAAADRAERTWQSGLPRPRHRLRGDGAATESRTGDVLTDTVPGDRARWPDST